MRKQGINVSSSCTLSAARFRHSSCALWAASTLLCCLGLVSRVWAGTDEPSSKAENAAGTATAKTEDESSLYVELRLSRSVKLSALKPGDVIEGNLSRDVYSEVREVFPAGSAVRLTVDKLERRRIESNDHWPGIIEWFSPRHGNYPTFRAAVVTLPSGLEVRLHVNLISIGRRFEIRAPAEKSSDVRVTRAAGSKPGEKPSVTSGSDASEASFAEKKTALRGQTVILEAAALTPEQGRDLRLSLPVLHALPQPVAAGTRGEIILVSSLSASKNHPGDVFSARLIEPVRVGSTIVLPEGSLLEGKVVKISAPRWLSRPGSLQMTFTGLTPPRGAAIPLVASLAGVELDQRSRVRMDSEGSLSGDKPGKGWILINLGVTAGITKAADDTTQLIMEALVSTATDASTAGAARIVAACASTLFMLTRHGRDVVLPRFTRMEIAFDRPRSTLRPLPTNGSR